MPIELRGQRSHLRRVHVDTTKPVVSDGSPASVSQTHKVGAVPKADVSTTKAGAGSKAALAGLNAIDRPRPKQGWTFRHAVAGALLGLSLLGAVTPQQARSMAKPPPHQTTELVVPRQTTGPPASSTATAGEAVVTGPPPDPPADRPAHVTDPLNNPGGVVVTNPGGPHVGLPDTLVTLGTGMSVTHGTDPGDFYCEHAFYTSTTEANRPGSSVLKNKDGEVLTAFLHNPADSFTYDASKTPVQRERHAERREIIGAAIRGYYETAQSQIPADAPFRMLITGYLQWGSVVNNPTGDFVLHPANIDAAMKAAFGDALMTSHAKVNGTVLEYRVLDASTGQVRKIEIDSKALPVSDEAINGGPDSLQHEMEAFKPHAVLSMGVAGGSPTFLAEFHADNGGIGVDVNGKQKHDDGKSPDKNDPDNYSLARALIIGRRMTTSQDIAPKTPVAGAGV